MAAQYPDMLGEFFEARDRFEADGIQYITHFDPSPVQTGQVTTLFFAIQSVLDSPIEFSLAITLPKMTKKLAGFTIAEAEITTTIQPGEVSELRVPIHAVDVPAGSYPFRLTLQSKIDRGAQRIRLAKSKGRMPATPIKDFIGLEVVSTIGIEYNSKPEKRPTLKLDVQAGAEPAETEIDLSPTLTELWKAEDLALQVRAAKEFNDRRIHIVSPLTQPVIFSTMLNESRQRFGDLGVQLTLGEAIFLSKILTRTVQLFLSDEGLQDALFVPIFQRLLAANVPFDNVIWLLMKFGYEHIVNLAIALSFGLLDNYRKERIWPVEEQRAVRRFIVQQLRRQEPLPVDLLYAPLILGGVMIGKQVALEGENLQQSLLSMKKSRDARLPELTQEDDQVVRILDELLSSHGVS